MTNRSTRTGWHIVAISLFVAMSFPQGVMAGEDGILAEIPPVAGVPEGTKVVWIAGDPRHGYPTWDPVEEVWTDVWTLRNPPDGEPIPMPILVRLGPIDPFEVEVVGNEYARLPRGAAFRFGSAPSSIRGTREGAWLEPGQWVSGEVSFRTPSGPPFVVQADLVPSGVDLVREGHSETSGVVYDSSDYPSEGLPVSWGLREQTETVVLSADDGTRERTVGSVTGSLIVGNRFPSRGSNLTQILAVGFDTALRFSPAQAELVIFHDPSGELLTPDGAQEIYRTPVTITPVQEPQFQFVGLDGAGVIVSGGNFFVGLRNLPGTSFKIGVDSTRPSGRGFMSINGGENYFPFSLEQLGDSQPMIRVLVGQLSASGLLLGQPMRVVPR